MANILVIEDESALARTIAMALSESGHAVEAVHNGEDGLRLARENEPDVILLDMRLPKMDGMEVLAGLKSESVSSAVIVMTAHGSIDLAVEAMKLGAAEFLVKPVDLGALELVVARVIERRQVAENLDYLRGKERSESGIGCIVGRSDAIEQIRQRICKLAESPLIATNAPPSVLITGETGAGKDVIARAIHYEGARSGGAFVHINCGAVPRELFEAELFGHVKGAFTSATQGKKGLMEVADGGTLFLDEIGHVDAAIQAKLLTAIEQKRIRPVGATRERDVNVHILAATNRDLATAIESGEFRADLYHRLRVFHVHITPLRERRDDIEPLADYFLKEFAGKTNLPVTGFSSEARDTMLRYDWPGNVRELAHVIESAVLMCDQHLIKPEHLQIHPPASEQKLEVSIAGCEPIEVDFTKPGSILADVEYALIDAAVKYSRYNISRAARILGITREAIRYRLRKHSERKSGDTGSTAQ